MNNLFHVVAGSNYGKRYVVYDVDGLTLTDIVADSGEDGLQNNDWVISLTGKTTLYVYAETIKLNSKPYSHSFDRCHICNWKAYAYELTWLQNIGWLADQQYRNQLALDKLKAIYEALTDAYGYCCSIELFNAIDAVTASIRELEARGRAIAKGML